MTGPLKNLLIIEQTGVDLPAVLEQNRISAGHFTNGTYAPPASLVVPTVLDAFQYAADNDADKNTPLIVAINSDISMAGIMDAKIAKGTATEADKNALESQTSRAEKVTIPLALQHPGRTVVAIFYDEETPNILYDLLDESGLHMKTLFKWGYGTDPKAGVIEGAEHFQLVNAHPLPNDIKPVCTELTRMTGQKGDIAVVDLRVVVGPHGKPYLTSKNECLFLLAPELEKYGPAKEPAQTIDSAPVAAKPAGYKP